MKIKRIGIVVFLLLALCLSACSKKEELVQEFIEPEVTTQEQEVIAPEKEEPAVVVDEPTEEVEVLPVIYEDNDLINLYLNRYNDANIDAPIERADFEVYYHHGSEHKNQIIFRETAFESIVITAPASNKVEVAIQGKVKDGITEEDYKQVFILYAKGYNAGLSEEVLEGYWKQVLENVSNYTDFEEFEVGIRRGSGGIEYITITGELQ